MTFLKWYSIFIIAIALLYGLWEYSNDRKKQLTKYISVIIMIPILVYLILS